VARRVTVALLGLLAVSCRGKGVPGNSAPPDLALPPPTGATASIDPDGRYTVRFANPAWTFRGSVGATVTDIATSAQGDAIGAYHELSFAWNDSVARTGVIRTYDDVPVALLTQSLPQGGPNTTAFPAFDQYPPLPYHVSYQTMLFAPPTFSALAPDSPWIFFDDTADAFVLSAASHFTNAATSRAADGVIKSSIDPSIATLPGGFAHTVALVAGHGIGRTMSRWGDVLLQRGGKPRIANDATVDLERLGYWTDNGATYYYAFDTQKGYAGTLLAVRDAFAARGLPLGYLQLDSWWYPKGAADTWSDHGGINQYTADATLFPSGLAAFQAQLGLPLITHARWIDPASPYRTQYTMSRNVITDANYWTSTAAYLRAGGVVTYEQDWLDQMALPATDNLVDQDAFLDNMATAMGQAGLYMQYCMPLPRHHLQSTRYANLATIRVTTDRFGRDRWHDFVYVAQLDAALGAWPWVDVFMSTEGDNLLLATLSAGMVGVGDAIDVIDAAALHGVARADGVLVKPDVPLVPLDRSWIDEARGGGAPMIATTYSDFGAMRATYVFAFGSAATVTLTPAELGYDHGVVVRDATTGVTTSVAPTAAFTAPLPGGRGYFVVMPVGAGGSTLLGDADKLVPLGKKRIARVADDAAGLHVDVVFAPGETTVRLRIWSRTPPTVMATQGSAGNVRVDPADGNAFLVDVNSNGGGASVTIR
jgi:hypothetical protein